MNSHQKYMSELCTKYGFRNPCLEVDGLPQPQEITVADLAEENARRERNGMKLAVGSVRYKGKIQRLYYDIKL